MTEMKAIASISVDQTVDGSADYEKIVCQNGPLLAALIRNSNNYNDCEGSSRFLRNQGNS